MSTPDFPLTLAALSFLLVPLYGQEPPERLDPQQSCTTNCHQEVTQRDFLHDPLRKEDCKSCHRQAVATEHGFEEIADIQETCAKCHEMELDAHVHAPLTDGECIDCHDPHGGRTKSLLLAKDEQTLCATCHPGIVDKLKMKFVHGPAAAGACSQCHAAHSAPEANLLAEEPIEVCFKCHEDEARRFDAADNQHAPIMIGCAPCHDAHGSDHRYLLASDIRTQCLSCHEELRESMETVGAWHGALDTPRSCLQCHQPHVSEHAKLLAERGQEGCADCHKESIAREGGLPIEAVSRRVAEAKSLHGPVQQGDCSACHDPHLSASPSLLVKAYPGLFYAKYESQTYALCFECHDRASIETERTTEATGFRDGDRNLHHLHVGRGKGRTCRACHEMHGSDLPHQMAEDVPFGQWTLTIDFQPLASGGSCAPSCHTAATYDRVKPSRLPGK